MRCCHCLSLMRTFESALGHVRGLPITWVDGFPVKLTHSEILTKYWSICYDFCKRNWKEWCTLLPYKHVRHGILHRIESNQKIYQLMEWRKIHINDITNWTPGKCLWKLRVIALIVCLFSSTTPTGCSRVSRAWCRSQPAPKITSLTPCFYTATFASLMMCLQIRTLSRSVYAAVKCNILSSCKATLDQD